MKKYLGIDFGSKRIGLATAEAEIGLATPLTTTTVEGLADILKQEGPFDAVVVGLPRNLAGHDTAQTLAVRRFVEDVLVRRFHLDPIFQDEAATSIVAEERLKDSGKPYDKADIDAEAAAIILQDYVDTL
jgi:putative holliday junction resolvase